MRLSLIFLSLLVSLTHARKPTTEPPSPSPEIEETCPALSICNALPTGSDCIKIMRHTVEVSGMESDYMGFLVAKYAQFHHSNCHDCIFVFWSRKPTGSVWRIMSALRGT